MKSVAVLGLGTMGGGMARRLLAAGVPLAVYNRTASRADELVSGGARFAATPVASGTQSLVRVRTI